jgi:hypothetical protein
MLGRWKHSGGEAMSGSEQREPTDEELRAAYEAQVKQLQVHHVVLETMVTLANLGMRRTGLAPGTEDERDAGQVRTAIESIRALMPVVEETAPEQARPLRDALSQLQLAFVRIGGAEAGAGAAGQSGSGSGTPGAGGSGTPGAGGSGTPGGGPAGEPPPSSPPERDEPGPAQRSGRLWVPGQ